jgi:hypothetical protein
MTEQPKFKVNDRVRVTGQHDTVTGRITAVNGDPDFWSYEVAPSHGPGTWAVPERWISRI